jgi:60 kDa SS-A/Ro ribonucleoprotein
MVEINARGETPDLVIYVSDNQSWLDAQPGRGTALMSEWAKLKERAPRAKLVCLDIQPFPNTQAAERADILNVGGFSDHVFTLIAAFAEGKLGSGHWVEAIEAVEL